MTGMNKYDRKERRKQRRHNHIARDLMTPKYKPRRIPNKKKDYDFDWDDDD